MSTAGPDQLFARIQEAIAAQSWREAWALLEQANPDYHPDDRHLGARRHDFLLAAATCMRHRGQLRQAERTYLILQDELSLTDPRLADVLLGRGEVAHAAGHHGEALQLLRAAAHVPGQDLILQARLATLQAHVTSHLEVERAVELFELAEERFASLDGTAAANLAFWHGDALLCAGSYREALTRLLRAHDLARASGAGVTLADAMRRLPLTRALLGQDDHGLRALKDIQGAEKLYRHAGDRGQAYLHTEAGEVHRSMGRWRDAEAAFSKGLWASRDIHDENRQAHNQLGLFEVSRQAGRPKPELLDDAWRLYERAGSDWGRLHVLLCRAQSDGHGRDGHLRQASELIGHSSFSRFAAEQEAIRWLRSAPGGEVADWSHLKNYP